MELRAGSARTPGLPLLQPPCVTLVKSLNPLIKEESVELSRRKLLISGDGSSGTDGCGNAESTGIIHVRMVFVAPASISSPQAELVLCSESLHKAVPAVKVKSRSSEVALAISEARLLSPRLLFMLVLTCLLSAQEEPPTRALFEVQRNR